MYLKTYCRETNNKVNASRNMKHEILIVEFLLRVRAS